MEEPSQLVENTVVVLWMQENGVVGQVEATTL